MRLQNPLFSDFAIVIFIVPREVSSSVLLERTFTFHLIRTEPIFIKYVTNIKP